jgi:hypothetical protein
MLTPIFSAIWKVLSHRFWNFKCFPFDSFALSHFRTKSPTSKFFSLALSLSNHLLTIYWWAMKFDFSFSLSSSSMRRVSILYYMTNEGCPLESWASWRDGRYSPFGRMASCPYTRKYGEFPIDSLGVTLSSHKALWSELCQFLWLSTTVFFNILTRFLLVDSTTPFPCG